MSTRSLTSKTYGSENQGVEAEMAPFTIIPRVSFEKSVLPGLAMWGSVVLRVSMSKEEMLTPGDTARVSLSHKLKFPPGHCRLLTPRASTPPE